MIKNFNRTAALIVTYVQYFCKIIVCHTFNIIVDILSHCQQLSIHLQPFLGALHIYNIIMTQENIQNILKTIILCPIQKRLQAVKLLSRSVG